MGVLQLAREALDQWCQFPFFLLARLEAAGAGSAVLSHCYVAGRRNGPAEPRKDAAVGCGVPSACSVFVCEVSCAVCCLLLDNLGVSATPWVFAALWDEEMVLLSTEEWWFQIPRVLACDQFQTGLQILGGCQNGAKTLQVKLKGTPSRGHLRQQ